VESKKITGGTLRNSVKTLKTFCEVTDIMIPWKKITRGLPRVKRYADDRAQQYKRLRKLSIILIEGLNPLSIQWLLQELE
jgi:hypothetical protein